MTKFIEVNDGTFDHIKMFIKHNHLDENNFDFAIESLYKLWDIERAKREWINKHEF